MLIINYTKTINQIAPNTNTSRTQQLEHDVTEKEDECMYWYRQFEDAKETRSKGSVKSRKCPIIKKRGKLT